MPSKVRLGRSAFFPSFLGSSFLGSSFLGSSLPELAKASGVSVKRVEAKKHRHTQPNRLLSGDFGRVGKGWVGAFIKQFDSR